MVRAATSADLGDVLRLYSQLNPDDPVLDEFSSKAVFDQILHTPGLTVLVLEEDGVIVGTTYLNVIPNLTRSASPYAVIENVVIDRGRRGKGLGKRMMAGTLHVAWRAGCYKAMLATGSRAPATHAFYRACGFSSDEKTSYVTRP
jgi:GNAT superfamily N-acetyltransferase